VTIPFAMRVPRNYDRTRTAKIARKIRPFLRAIVLPAFRQYLRGHGPSWPTTKGRGRKNLGRNMEAEKGVVLAVAADVGRCRQFRSIRKIRLLLPK